MYGRRDVVNDCQSWVVHWKAGMYGGNALLRWFLAWASGHSKTRKLD